MSKPESEYKQSPEAPHESDVRETGTQGRRRRSRQPHLETSVNMEELRELIALIQENGFAEFELEREGFRIHVRRDLAHYATAQICRDRRDAAHRQRTRRSVLGLATPDHPERGPNGASEDQDPT